METNYVITGILPDKCRLRVTEQSYPSAEAAQADIDLMWNCPLNNPQTLEHLWGKREDMAPRQGKQWTSGFIHTPEDEELFQAYLKRIEEKFGS